jgi:hypothetical protein
MHMFPISACLLDSASISKNVAPSITIAEIFSICCVVIFFPECCI